MASHSDRADQLGAAAARVVLNDSIDGSHIEAVQVFRLGDHPSQCLFFEDVGEVEQGPGDGRHGNPVPHGDLVGPKPRRSVNAKPGPLATALRRNDHVDVRRVALTKVPQSGGISMRQRRPGPAGHNSGQPAPVARQAIVANGVDTLVHAAQPAGSYPVRDPTVSQPNVDQLRTRNHTPLPLGKLSQEG
jgi:hypothetical protein